MDQSISALGIQVCLSIAGSSYVTLRSLNRLLIYYILMEDDMVVATLFLLNLLKQHAVSVQVISTISVVHACSD